MDTSDTSPNRIPSPSASSPSTSLWRSAAYRRWFAADTSDVVAVNLRAFVIPLIALQLSGSAFAAGLIVTIESAIGLVLMPIGGTLTDRHDRRRMMIGLGVIGLILSLAATALLGARAMTIGLFAVLVMAFAVMNGLLGPSNDAILKSIVPMDRFAKAQAVREAREACVELSGGAIGGLLYTVGSWFPFLTSAALYGVAAVTAAGLPADSGHGGHRDGEAPASFVAHFIEGWRWAMTRRTVVAAIAQGGQLFTQGTIMAKTAAALHILVKEEKLALDLLEQIKNGADFGKLAKKHSICPSGKRGGDLGEFRQGQMVPAFDKVVFSCPVLEPTGPLHTQFGYHIIKVLYRN